MVEFACSFCAKGLGEVRKLITGPKVFICDECIQLCNDILAEDGPMPAASLPRPGEIQELRARVKDLEAELAALMSGDLQPKA